MNTSISKSEKEALDELFLAMKERSNLLTRLQSRRKEMIRLLKTILIKQKTTN